MVDAVGLITFGIGKGLIGGAEATAEISETASSAYQTIVKAGDGSVGSIIEAGGGATKAAMDIEGVKLTAKMVEQMKEVGSVRPVFRTAMKAWQDGKFGDALAKDAVGTLGRGLRSAAGLGSVEIGSALSKAVEAGDDMPYAKGHLEPGRRERAVTALVNRQFAGIDNAPHLKTQARQQLLAQTQAAQAAGGLATCRRI
jgi:hypothetical protein